MTLFEFRDLPRFMRWGMTLRFLRSQARSLAITAGSLAGAAALSFCLLAFIVMGPRYSIERGSQQERALVAYLSLSNGSAAQEFMESQQAAGAAGRHRTLVPVNRAQAWLDHPSPLAVAALSRGPISSELEPLRLAGLQMAKIKVDLVKGMGPAAQCPFTQAIQVGFASPNTPSGCWEPKLRLISWLVFGGFFFMFCLFSRLIGSFHYIDELSGPIRLLRRNHREWLENAADEDFRILERAALQRASKKAPPPGALGKKTPRI